MSFGQNELIALIAFIMLWWLFYFAIKMRADQKYMKSDHDEDLRPCMGCMVTQSAVLAACTLAVFFAAYFMGWIGFSQP